ncbi:MAG: sensor histidine kinase [Propionibacteriaceae bacterium]|jgi:signal transduction histidine kinase|nr:sensor histidine kinase [Propionibacteriaceae bacterium]
MATPLTQDDQAEPRPGRTPGLWSIPPTAVQLGRWTGRRAQVTRVLMVACAGLIAIFGPGGIAWMYLGAMAFLGTPMLRPSAWAVAVVTAGFLATTVAFWLWQWRQPMAFFFAATGFQVLWTLAFQVHQPAVGIGAWVFLWFALYYICQRLTTLLAWICLGVDLALHASFMAVFQTQEWGSLTVSWRGQFTITLVINLAASAFAILRGTRRGYVDTLVERNRLLSEQRDQRAELAVAAERSRIARELHDIVSHSLAVMVTLSDGAARLVRSEPEAAAKAMAEISHTGRRAVGDMRRLLAFVRSEADLKPQPSLNDLGDLVASLRQSGLPAKINLSTTLPQDAAFGLTVYRIVQEALTNVLRHAPASPEVTVQISRPTPDRIDITVDNAPGASPLAVVGSGSGHGLVGMRQRVAVWGGALEAGPRPGGGWRVHATLPLEGLDEDED